MVFGEGVAIVSHPLIPHPVRQHFQQAAYVHPVMWNLEVCTWFQSEDVYPQFLVIWQRSQARIPFPDGVLFRFMGEDIGRAAHTLDKIHTGLVLAALDARGDNQGAAEGARFKFRKHGSLE